MTQVRVRAVHHEEVRKAGDRDAEISMRPRAPFVAEQTAVATRHLHRREELRALEAGRENHHVRRMSFASARTDAVARQAVDAIGDEPDVGATQGRIIVVVEEYALGADRIVRHQPGTQARVGHLPAQVRKRPPAGKRLHWPHLFHDGCQLNLSKIKPLALMVELCERGPARQQALRTRGIQSILARQQPVRRALEDRESSGQRRDLRDELHRAGRVADHGNSLRRQVDRVVPLRGMKFCARRTYRSLRSPVSTDDSAGRRR